MSVERWPREDLPGVEDYHIFRLRRHRATSPRSGVTGTYVGIESPDWANVIPITEAGEVVLIRQYRQGIDQVILELPGGIIDPGESAATASARELAEETGYVATAWQELGSVQANPAFMNNSCHNFLATGCRLHSPTSLDAGEDIEVVLFPLPEVGRMLRDGTIRHAMVIAAFFGYLQAGEPCGPLFAR